MIWKIYVRNVEIHGITVIMVANFNQDKQCTEVLIYMYGIMAKQRKQDTIN